MAAARRQAGQGIQAGDADAADVLERFVHRPIDAARRQHVGDRRRAVGGARGDHLDEAAVADLRFEDFAALGGGWAAVRAATAAGGAGRGRGAGDGAGAVATAVVGAGAGGGAGRGVRTM